MFAMLLKRHFTLLFFSLSLLSAVNGGCYDPSPAFPLPTLEPHARELRQAFAKIESSLKDTISQSKYDTSSFSLEITSSKKTLFSLFHTAKEKDDSRPGAATVDETSSYRIASCTKVFTVLGVLKQVSSGNLSLDDPVDKYICELSAPQKGSIPWKDITLRSLGSQLSGIPSDYAQSDLINDFPDPTKFGLPPSSKTGLPKCDEYDNYRTACTEEDLLDSMRDATPLFPPNQQSTYSNINYELLGLVLANVTRMPYEDYIHEMLETIGLDSTTFTKPSDKVAVLPKGENYYWDVDEGVQNPTGGLYSSSSDLSKFLRYVLTHYNGITPAALNWLHPASYSAGMHSFFGMPWEIFRTDGILRTTRRPVNFVTKSGGLPAYRSIMIVVPEYDLGITILVAGNGFLFDEIRQIVTAKLIPAVEAVAQRQMHQKYVGAYAASKQAGINSSLVLSHSPSSGLYISEFVSNGTDLFTALVPLLAGPANFVAANWRLQLVPTLLFTDEKNQEGEQWRALLVPQKRGEDIWDEFCINNIDTIRYAGRPLNEVVFWSDKHGHVPKVELPAFKITMEKETEVQHGGLQALSRLFGQVPFARQV